MLSIGSPKTPKAAQEYLLQDDPYFRGGNSAWFGKAAQALGLTGQIEDEAFHHLLAGSDPGGKRLVRSGGPARTRIAGFDLAFSAPKSCSLVSLCDSRVVDAHSAAVKTALAFAEDRYAQARAMAGGKQVVVDTGNIAAALFVHMTSRALDPQLHTHAFVLNITRRPEDGQWRALHRGKQIRTGRGTTAVLSNPFYRHRLLLGQIYQNELARDLATAGYRIRITDPQNGLWEMAGVPDSLILAFSKRRTEIERQAKDYRERHPDTVIQKVYDRATLNTRLWKAHDVTREELTAMWRASAEHLGTPLETLPQLAMRREGGARERIFPGDGAGTPDTPEDLLARAVAYLQSATGHKPTREQVLLASLRLGVGSYGIESIGGSTGKDPPSSEHDKTPIEGQDLHGRNEGKHDRRFELEI